MDGGRAGDGGWVRRVCVGGGGGRGSGCTREGRMASTLVGRACSKCAGVSGGSMGVCVCVSVPVCV